MHPLRHLPIFQAKEWRLLKVEALSTELCVSRAFIRLCLNNGCPHDGALLSAAGLLEWLFDNYNRVRIAAGFHPCAPLDGVPNCVQHRLRMANALLTLFEFSESRATSLREKRALRDAYRHVEWALERR